MKRLGPFVFLAVLALAAVRAAGQEVEEFIPQETCIRTSSCAYPSRTAFGALVGFVLFGAFGGLMLAILALTLGMYDEARGLGRFCLGCGVLTFCCAGMENSVNPWSDAWGWGTFAFGALAAAMGWCIQRFADGRLAPHRVRRSESAAAIRRANRRRGVTLPDSRSRP